MNLPAEARHKVVTAGDLRDRPVPHSHSHTH
jgi:hypothetical protein